MTTGRSWNLSVPAQQPLPCALHSPGRLHSDYPPASFPGLLASVPSCVEDLSNPVAEPSSSQAGSVSAAGECSWPPEACVSPGGTAEPPPLRSLRAEDGGQDKSGLHRARIPPGETDGKGPMQGPDR